MGNYDIEKIRSKLKKSGSKSKDPNEFRPQQPQSESDSFKYRFYILPPLKAGDKCAEGVASKDMDLFYVPNGNHWINNVPHPCPRIHDEETCPLCDFAFDLMNETSVKDERSKIAKAYLPRGQYAMNIYFVNTESNPEEYRGKVMWYNPSKQVYDILEACLMREDGGDPDDPQAHGVFFDEANAYMFQLECLKENGYTSYKSSKFLATIGQRPIATKTVDGEKVADNDQIKEIMDSRFDLFTKFNDRDHQSLQKTVDKILNRDTSDDDAGFDEDEDNKGAVSTTTTNSKVVSEDLDGEGGVAKDDAAKTESSGGSDDDDSVNSDVSDMELEDMLGQLD